MGVGRSRCDVFSVGRDCVACACLRYWLLPALIVRGVVCSLRFEEDHTTGASFASVLKRISLTQTQAALCFLKLFSPLCASSISTPCWAALFTPTAVTTNIAPYVL